MSSMARSTTGWDRQRAPQFAFEHARAFAFPPPAQEAVCSPAVSLELEPPGVDTYSHLICETFKIQPGVDILHVPYRGTGKCTPHFLVGIVHPKLPSHLAPRRRRQ